MKIIIEDKNKSKPKSKSKILVLGLIIIFIFVGFFGVTGKASADYNSCVATGKANLTAPVDPDKLNKVLLDCANQNPDTAPKNGVTLTDTTGTCTDSTGKTSTTTQANCTGTWSQTAPQTPPSSDFEAAATQESCANFITGGIKGCIKSLFYYVVYLPSAFILLIAAKLFNAFLSITLSSTLFSGSTFIPTAWAVTRDLSNIFFILILLYIAFQMILGIGGHDTKKMIAQVMIMALLINFSMFFTQVVIDASNMIALVFYNKLNVDITSNGVPRPDTPSTKNERDVSGGMYYAFDPTTKLNNQNFFDGARKQVVNGKEEISPNAPLGVMLGVMLISVAIMLFAAYCFFVSGFSFLARMIELWMLIIFSPFALMSSTVPFLSGVEYLGWNSWISRLWKTAFMAPIFMFFLYFIFLLLKPPGLFGNLITTQGTIQTILSVTIPAMVILILLMKATEYAKKGAGAIGDMVLNGAKLVGGLAVGATGLGVAFAGRTAIGRTTAALSRREDSVHYGKARITYNKKLEEWQKKEKETKGSGGTKPEWDKHWDEYKTANSVKEDNKGFLNKTLNKVGGGEWAAALGGRVNAAQSRTGEVDHARHEIDELKKKAGLEGVADNFLSGVEKEKIENTFLKDNRTGIESEIRRGYDGKGRLIGEDGKPTTDETKSMSESKFKAAKRGALTSEILANPEAEKNGDIEDKIVKKGTGKKDAAGKEIMEDVVAGKQLSKQGEKKVEDQLNTAFNKILQDLAGNIAKQRFSTLQHEATEKVGMGERMLSRSNSGTYDVRNLSELKKDRRDGIGTKAAIGLTALIATGIRTGLKKGVSVDVGTPQGNIFKDMGQTINEALKHAKIDLKIGGDGGGGAHGPAAHAHAPSDGGHGAPAKGGGHGGGHGGGGHH